MSRQKWRILDYVKCGKPNKLSGQRLGAFHDKKTEAILDRLLLSEESDLPGDSGSGQEMDDADQELETGSE